jgi:hypothetical protein
MLNKNRKPPRVRPGVGLSFLRPKRIIACQVYCDFCWTHAKKHRSLSKCAITPRSDKKMDLQEFPIAEETMSSSVAVPPQHAAHDVSLSTQLANDLRTRLSAVGQTRTSTIADICRAILANTDLPKKIQTNIVDFWRYKAMVLAEKRPDHTISHEEAIILFRETIDAYMDVVKKIKKGDFDDDVYERCEKCNERTDELSQLHLGRKSFLVCGECGFELAPEGASYNECATCNRVILNSATRRTKCKVCVKQ